MGVNAWVIHGDESIWGDDADQFQPERWLVGKEKLTFFEQHFLAVSSMVFSSRHGSDIDRRLVLAQEPA